MKVDRVSTVEVKKNAELLSEADETLLDLLESPDSVVVVSHHHWRPPRAPGDDAQLIFVLASGLPGSHLLLINSDIN